MATHFQTTIRGASEPLTIDTLRGYPGCEHYTDDEAADIIQTLDALARIFLQAAARHGTHYDHQPVSPITLPAADNSVLNRAA